MPLKYSIEFLSALVHTIKLNFEFKCKRVYNYGECIKPGH